MKLRVYLLSALVFLTILSGVLAASNNYYAVTTVYFNIPYDASFRIAMPSSYTFYSVTGVDYSSATPTTPLWVSFNFTSTPQGHVEPYAQGISTDTQGGLIKPIFRYDPSGNTPIKIYINLTSLPTGIKVEAYGVCDPVGSCTNPIASPVNLTANVETLLVESLPTTSYFNLTLYGYADNSAQAGQSPAISMYHHSTRA